MTLITEKIYGMTMPKNKMMIQKNFIKNIKKTKTKIVLK